ncbi:alpha/beta-Hydrolases superfamily protein [Zea mays]|uniref:Alpha/beta-Hydrolases superfamily protein n=2 Tax=Zea mays TaxID=4577 RepID=A0A1D6NQU4_MAIZE|nr:alpha/beta-Hydrolases superfamily protein [Zea mays]
MEGEAVHMLQSGHHQWNKGQPTLQAFPATQRLNSRLHQISEETKKMAPKLVFVLPVVLLALALQAILRPPPPKLCGSPGGPPLTSPRIKLRDGRYLAYKEDGVQRDKARYKIITVHAFDSTKDFPSPVSKELVEGLGIYLLAYDRAGYGESDPNPNRHVKSEALDIEELADQLGLGHKFYVLGASMGGYSVWGCLQLAGAALVVPIINYWWPSFPAELSKQAFNRLIVPEQRTLWIAHNIPSLLYLWMTQRWFPSSAAAMHHPEIFSKHDMEVLQKMMAMPRTIENKSRQQGIYESIHRDLLVAFGTWEFDPMNVTNPFPQNEGSVHIWQGREDRLVLVELQRYIAKKLPWIKYHEVPEGGHMFVMVDGWTDRILKALLLGEEPLDV